MLQNPSITLVNCRVKTAISRTVAAMFNTRSFRAVVISTIVPPTMSSTKPNVIRPGNACRRGMKTSPTDGDDQRPEHLMDRWGYPMHLGVFGDSRRM